MKLLFENWRQYLKEAAQTLESMPDDVFIVIEKYSRGDSAYRIYLIQGKKKVGSCGVNKVPEKLLYDEEIDELEDWAEYHGHWKKFDDCLDNWGRVFDNLYTLHIQVDPSMKGYGPLLTDLAMELATYDNKWIIFPNLVGHHVSDDAKKLIKYYFTNRSDVFKEPIDMQCWYFHSSKDISGEEEMFRHLYRKDPDILNSQTAKTKIKWIK